MLSEVDVDLEDLESRLYSQVYHLNYEENQPSDNSIQRIENFNIPDNQNGARYYKMGNFANQKQQTTNHSSNNTSSFVPSIHKFNADPHSLSGAPFINLREVPPLIPQVINMMNPINNIVVLPQATPHFLRTNALQPYINKNLEKFLRRQNSRLKRSMRRKIQKERRRTEKLNASLNEPDFQRTIFGMEPCNDQNLKNNKPFEVEKCSNIPTEIIDESDSDDSCCIVIKDENSFIVLSSDESVDVDTENNTHKSKKKLKNLESSSNNLIENKNYETSSSKKLNEVDDDVIFVEPKPVEVIEIDVDPPQSVVDLNAKYIADADASKQQDTETSSSNSTDKANTKQGMTSKERRELLNTPDSTTSNDFLVNLLEAPHTRFNFGLHDSDFCNSPIFLKPKSQADAYETESSCSTSDISSTPIKTALFNEVEFETPVKQLFDDTNLEGFGNYITPNRSGSCSFPSILTTDFEQVKTRVTKTKRSTQADSDSSSENEFDGSKVLYLDARKVKQTLPNLCPIELIDKPKGKTNKTKKKKLSNAFNDGSPAKQTGNKRKSNFEASDEDNNEAQKKSKTKNDQEQNHSVGVSDNGVVSARKPNQNESKRNKNRKDFNDGNDTKENAEKDATVTSSVEETNIKEDEIKNALAEDCPDINDQAITINSDTDEVEIIENKAESLGIKGMAIENTLENMVTSNFIILDETADEKDSSDGSSVSSFEGNFLDFEEFADDLSLANCESGTQHPTQSDVPKKRTTFADCWNADSEKFHSRSWGLENFSVEETQKSMTDDPDLWKIVDRDRVFVRLNIPRGQRCRRCREIGHFAYKCKNEPAIPSCTLCGTKGHVEARCPNAVCTTCGILGNYTTYCSNCAYWKSFQCKICKVFGHFDWACPDLWRRYHLTTKPGPIVVPEKSRGKLFQDKWCSSCAKFGHYEQNCRFANRTHFVTVSEVKEYADIYNFPKSQPTITLSENIEENNQKVQETSVQQERSKHFEEANNEIEMRVSNEMLLRDVIVIDETDNSRQTKVIYPPEHMIPSYFQQQLSYLKFGEPSTSESAKKRESLSNISALIADGSLNLGQETINKLNSGELRSKRILLLTHKYAYLHSRRGQEFINKIRARSNINVIVKRSSPNAAEVGIIILYGNEKEVDVVSNEFNTFLHDVSTINIRIIPKDSDLLYTFLFKALRQLRFTQGNSKLLLDSILNKKQKLFASGIDWRNKAAILTMYHRLNILLFGRCKLQDGGKHLAKLESWLKSTRNKHFIVRLTDRFNIYEAYVYIYKSLRSDDEYASLCRNVNYHIDVEKPNAVDGMTRKQRLHFSKKVKEIIKNCKKYNLVDELRQITNIQVAVFKSDYSRPAYEDFLRYVSYFTKYFCNFRNSKI